jgi:hypothetical protein
MKKNLIHSYICCVALLSIAEAAPWEIVESDGVLKYQYQPTSVATATSTFSRTTSHFSRVDPLSSTPLVTVAELRFPTIEPAELTFSESLIGYVSLREEIQGLLQSLNAVEEVGSHITFHKKLSVSCAIHVIPNDLPDNSFLFALDRRSENPERVTFLALSSHVQITVVGQKLQDQDRIELEASSLSDGFPITISQDPRNIAQRHAWWEMQNQGFDASFAFATILTFPEDIEVLVSVFIPHREELPLELELSKRVCNYALRPFFVRPSIALASIPSASTAEIHGFAVSNEIATMQALFRRNSSLASTAIHPRTFFDVVSYGSFDMLKLLLEHNADVNACPKGERLTPLQVAMRLQNPMKIELLQSHGAQASSEGDDSGNVSDDSSPASTTMWEEEEEEEEENE